VFLVLAAQYENYIDPTIIMLTVPLAVLGALLAVMFRGLSSPNFANDVYTQIGLVMLIGMASKNAILIVEFANQLHERGLSITKAVLEAARQRLRPILMTAFATVIGIVPLVIASGAGAAARQSIGTAVMGGMCVATLLSLFIVPILYIVVKTIEKRMRLDVHDHKTSNIVESALVAEYGDTYSNYFHDVHGDSINGDRLNPDRSNGKHDTPHNNSNSNSDSSEKPQEDNKPV
jgi:HAE1 family hydrophobic/amphiphilic exporter-1